MELVKWRLAYPITHLFLSFFVHGFWSQRDFSQLYGGAVIEGHNPAKTMTIFSFVPTNVLMNFKFLDQFCLYDIYMIHIRFTCCQYLFGFCQLSSYFVLQKNIIIQEFIKNVFSFPLFCVYNIYLILLYVN